MFTRWMFNTNWCWKVEKRCDRFSDLYKNFLSCYWKNVPTCSVCKKTTYICSHKGNYTHAWISIYILLLSHLLHRITSMGPFIQLLMEYIGSFSLTFYSLLYHIHRDRLFYDHIKKILFLLFSSLKFLNNLRNNWKHIFE